MKKDLIEVIMNPIRQRIIQYLIIHTKGTTGEMRAELKDIPPASLYRHMKILLENGCIEVIEEKKVRGTTEKTYKLVENLMAEPNEQDIAELIQHSFFSLMGTFQRYFAKGDRDPAKDMLSLSTSTLLLTDEEFMEFYKKIGAVFNECVMNQPAEGRKERRITFISSPKEE